MTFTSRTLSVNDLNVFILESNPSNNHPLVLLLHGFPELSFSWRKLIQPIADAGYHVVAPDQRGFGRTAPSTPIKYADEIAPFRLLNLVNDIISLVAALGHSSVFAVIGHDFGSPVAGYCAYTRPDIFKSLVLMSAPFTGPPPPLPPSDPDPSHHPTLLLAAQLSAGLASLSPPRKHYTQYFSSPSANTDMSHPPDGLPAFLRSYFISKSALCPQPHTQPHPLPGLTLSSLSVLPPYYIMPLDATMPQVVSTPSPHPPPAWLTDPELDVYVSEYTRTGFQGGLNWYRTLTDPVALAELSALSPPGEQTATMPVPTMFIAGKEDWGVYQFPGAAELMRHVLCQRTMAPEDFVLVEDAGHWVQQEAPKAVVSHLLRFFHKLGPAQHSDDDETAESSDA